LKLYRRGERICKIWARKNNTRAYIQNISRAWDTDHSMTSYSESSHLDITSSSSDGSNSNCSESTWQFNSSMYDCLGRVIVAKVFSHKLNSDFSIKNSNKRPRPNMFITSANQVADNVVTQAHELYNDEIHGDEEVCFYPPFSPRWNFSFDGRLINKGASKPLNDKMDEELILRQQHRCKQGALLRMTSFNSLGAEQIGEESLLRNILKITVPCWTRCIYRYP